MQDSERDRVSEAEKNECQYERSVYLLLLLMMLLLLQCLLLVLQQELLLLLKEHLLVLLLNLVHELHPLRHGQHAERERRQHMIENECSYDSRTEYHTQSAEINSCKQNGTQK